MMEQKKLKKEITFICTDKAEEHQMYPIYKEAQNRGYKVKITKNIFEKCEIGFYCQHDCYPKNSKFSIITLHDIGQSHGIWPDIWVKEPWDNFDIGILPGKEWSRMWKESSCYPYTRAKIGVYEIGWPKADILSKNEFTENVKKLKEKLKIDFTKKTILYAPSWENDGKQDDFVKALSNKNVNILIKQAWYDPDKYDEIIGNIKIMDEIHKNIENVFILDPAINIFEAISLSDLLVSDESSTMFEAMLLGIPSLAVIDWLIPDTIPKRIACVPYGFVEKTERKYLEKKLEEMLKNLEKYEKKTKEYRDKNFKNIGQTSSKIMDIVDSVIFGKEIKERPIQPVPIKKIDNLNYKKYRAIRIKTQFIQKIIKPNYFLNSLYKIYLKIKKKIRENRNV